MTTPILCARVTLGYETLGRLKEVEFDVILSNLPRVNLETMELPR